MPLELRVPVLERGVFAVECGNPALGLALEFANRLLELLQHLQLRVGMTLAHGHAHKHVPIRTCMSHDPTHSLTHFAPPPTQAPTWLPQFN